MSVHRIPDVERAIYSFLTRTRLFDRLSAVKDLFQSLEACSECDAEVASVLLEAEDFLWSLPSEAKFQANSMVLVLIGALTRGCREVRLAAVGGLGGIGLQLDIVVPCLLRVALRDPSEEVRESAVLAIGSFGRTCLPALKRLLLEGSVGVRSRATYELGFAEDVSAEEVVPELIHALCDPEHRVILTAAAGLARIGPSAEAAAPVLIRLLEIDSLYQAMQAALIAIGHSASSALYAALKHKVPKVRARAAEVLAELEPHAEKTKRLLYSLLWDVSPDVASTALSALRKIELPFLHAELGER